MVMVSTAVCAPFASVKVNRAEYLRRRELAKFRSDAQVAAVVGITRQRLSQILNGSDVSGASFGVISRLAQALECPIEAIIHDDPAITG